MTLKIKLTFCSFLVILFSVSASAQCNPSYDTTNLCSNSNVKFKANASGFTAYEWEYKVKSSGQVIGTSTNRDPVYNFTAAGTYAITLKASGVSGTCTKTIDLVIKPSPIARPVFISPSRQCFEGNQFCFLDSSSPALGSQILRRSVLFSDGQRYTANNPSIGDAICHSIIDSKGAVLSMKMELADKNGCLTETTFDSFIQAFPPMNVRISSNSPVKCDSTKATITNRTYTDWRRDRNSTIGLKDIARFEFDFGGGDPAIIIGDSVTNTSYWTGDRSDGIIEHWYRKPGVYEASLKVTSKYGCTETFKLKEVATTVSHTAEIIADKQVYTPNESVQLGIKGGVSPAALLWQFGDPISGPENFHNASLVPSHTYSTLGPKMISLRMIVGPCDIMAYDTVFIQGPLAKIEAPYNRILEKEKYQCRLSDTVHFTNNSSFWLNDANPADEDSVVTVNGEKRYVFNYNETTRSGDQTAITSSQHLDNRTMGSQVFRLWDFGDEHADKCTTATDLNINVGKNCNYSTDEFPMHKYKDWETVYQEQYYAVNDTFYHVTARNGTCSNTIVDTSNKVLHRYIFRKTIAHNFKASLYLKDTISGNESKDYVDIIGMEPDASRMTIDSDNFCPSESDATKHYVTFNLNTGGQSYFAVNFDSVANPTKFVASNSGDILAPPAPGSAIPFVLPYGITGQVPVQFIKGFTQTELGVNATKNSNSVGLIVGNGPLGPNGEPPTCLDTAWYHNLLNVNVLHAGFDILGGKTTTAFCKGDTVYFKPSKEIQPGLKQLSWNWGDPNKLDVYYEDFRSMEKYIGPVSTRNDKDVVYNGEDWLYNYVVRHEITDLYGDVILDTIVTALIKDHWLDYVGEGGYYLSNAKPGRLVESIPHNEVYKYIGTCIDTTAMSHLFVAREFRATSDGSVFEKGNKRYRYTDGSNTDSVEVSEILHFRDSSVQGFDTAIIGTDTITGVWRHIYTHSDVVTTNGTKDTVVRNSTGSMQPSFYISNQNACVTRQSKPLTVGFILYLELLNKAVCENDLVELYDSVRYWQLGDDHFPNDYPMDPRKFWEDPYRYAIGKLEIKSVDWDASDGIGNEKQRSISMFHQYDDPGTYTMTFFAKDSLGCLDTAQRTVDITGIRANYQVSRDMTNPCSPVFTFLDSSKAFTNTNADSVIWYQWDFGDGSENSILKNPVHTYKRFGWRDVKLKIYSELGCSDSVTKQLYVAGPIPEFEFIDNPWGNFFDSATIYVGDTLKIKNTSHDPMYSPSFIFDWGDNHSTSATDINFVFKHTYDEDGLYYPNLYMEEAMEGTSVRCFSYFPVSNTGVWTPSRDIIVLVLPDTTNGVANLSAYAAVYPNPSTGSFTVTTLESNNIIGVELTNVLGQPIRIDVKWQGENRLEVEASHLKSGNYFLILHTEQGMIRKKMTILN